jgi:hypothetical protein
MPAANLSKRYAAQVRGPDSLAGNSGGAPRREETALALRPQTLMFSRLQFGLPPL